jgi:XTP/dITP diphosphohydrolase
MELIFATQNKNKVAEVQSIVPTNIKLYSLADKNILDDIPEPFDTLEANAIHKATYIKQKFGYDCFSEDTGLIVPSLNGEPGVYSARYAGEHGNAKANMEKLLSKLVPNKNREAYFKTIIALLYKNEQHLFIGECHGQIIQQAKGELGFGYDPIFIPNGAAITFAEMDLEQKNKYSHRKKAVTQLLRFLENEALVP